MKSSDGNACELVINNARIFDGSAVLQGPHNVGIAGDRIQFHQQFANCWKSAN